jgi:hypothetical protein
MLLLQLAGLLVEQHCELCVCIDRQVTAERREVNLMLCRVNGSKAVSHASAHAMHDQAGNTLRMAACSTQHCTDELAM